MLRDLYCYKPADAHGVSTQEKLCGSSAFLDLIEPFACTTLPNPGVYGSQVWRPRLHRAGCKSHAILDNLFLSWLCHSCRRTPVLARSPTVSENRTKFLPSLFSRLYLLKARRLNLAECLIVLSTLVDIASCVLIHFQIKTGMGKHIEYSRERPIMLQASMKFGLAQNSVYQALVGYDNN